MNWIIREIDHNKNMKNTARCKARDDVDSILIDLGFKPLNVNGPQEQRAQASFFKRLFYHLSTMRVWLDALKDVKPGDTIFIQYPVFNHTIFLHNVFKKIKKRRVKIIAVVHDLNSIRQAQIKDAPVFYKLRIKQEEISALKDFSKIIVHNNKMLRLMADRFSIDEERMIPLGIFDYLTKAQLRNYDITNYKSCIIAGNLEKKKAGYVYKLPSNCKFELYGSRYEGQTNGFCTYHGSYAPEILPSILEGGFGLVWDGDSIETCKGIWGDYLRYNNPHKTSLYLASGIPVIVWENAAVADFIKENKVGVLIDSLDNLANVLNKIDFKQYEEMKKNTEMLALKLRNGFFTKKALNRAMAN